MAHSTFKESGKQTTLDVICQEATGTCYAAIPDEGYQNNGYQHP